MPRCGELLAILAKSIRSVLWKVLRWHRAETLEFSGSIGGQTHRGTNFSQFQRLFVDICGQPPLT
jgi:hypothetical protein